MLGFQMGCFRAAWRMWGREGDGGGWGGKRERSDVMAFWGECGRERRSGWRLLHLHCGFMCLWGGLTEYHTLLKQCGGGNVGERAGEAKTHPEWNLTPGHVDFSRNGNANFISTKPSDARSTEQLFPELSTGSHGLHALTTRFCVF